jgi:hypothetical protein
LQTGALKIGDEVARYTGVVLTSTAFSNMLVGLDIPYSNCNAPMDASRLSRGTQVGVHTHMRFHSHFIVHEPLFRLALQQYRDLNNPKVKLDSVMNDVPFSAIEDCGGSWFLMNDSPDNTVPNVKMSTTRTGGRVTVVFTAIADIDASQDPVELLYEYGTSKQNSFGVPKKAGSGYKRTCAGGPEPSQPKKRRRNATSIAVPAGCSWRHRLLRGIMSSAAFG